MDQLAGVWSTEPEMLDRPLTWDDLTRYWVLEDRLRYEIIFGQLVTTPTPWIAHQAVVGDLLYRIGGWTANEPGATVLSYVAVKLSPHDIVVPDLLYFAGSRRDVVGEEAIEGVPDLIVEVMDRITRERDRTRKAQLYAASGVREFWLADPDARTMVINVLRDGRYEPVPFDGHLVPSRVLNGLVIDVPALFADLL